MVVTDNGGGPSVVREKREDPSCTSSSFRCLPGRKNGGEVSSSSLGACKRQRKRRKERERVAKKRRFQQHYEALDAKYSPYLKDRFMFSSCTRKNRYRTKELDIRARIVGSARRGANLRWNKCGRCINKGQGRMTVR